MSKLTQPIFVDEDGLARFRMNTAVRALVDHGQKTGFGLNEIAKMDIPQADRAQLAQLIGYSVHGFNELNFVSDLLAAEANRAAKRLGVKPGCRATGCAIHCGVDDDDDGGGEPAAEEAA